MDGYSQAGGYVEAVDVGASLGSAEVVGLRLAADFPLLVVAVILLRYLTQDLDKTLRKITELLEVLCRRGDNQ